MEVKIKQNRLNDLLRIEKIMRACEAAGIDNWEGYEIALDTLQKDFDLRDLIDDSAQEILEGICMMIDEPAGQGAGYGFDPDAESFLTSFLENFINKYKKI